MSEMKIALVDDERLFLDEMVSLCKAYSKSRDLQIELSSFSGGNEFLAAVKESPSHQFSIVFLDIYMNDIDGIATAKALREADPECLLVFLTSSRDFMPEAFGCHAFDYISKPINSERLEKVLDDALRFLPSTHKFIELVSERKTYQVFLKDIVYAVTDGHYLNITLVDGSTMRQRMTAAEFLARAGNDDRFFLANRGIILNVGHIVSFEDGCCIMKGGIALPMRVKEARQVEQAVMNRSFETIRRRQDMGRNDK